jgi:hypothetical protein
MERMFLGFRLAIESIFGLIFLGNSIWSVVQSFQSHILVPATLIGLVVGSLFVWDAFRLRRVMNRVDEEALAPKE